LRRCREAGALRASVDFTAARKSATSRSAEELDERLIKKKFPTAAEQIA